MYLGQPRRALSLRRLLDQVLQESGSIEDPRFMNPTQDDNMHIGTGNELIGGWLGCGLYMGGDAFFFFCKYRHCSLPMPSLVSRDHTIEADTGVASDDFTLVRVTQNLFV